MRKLTRAAAVLFVFALAASAQSPAQNWNNVTALAAGTPVRISVGSRTVRGQVQGVTDDSLAVNSGKGQERFTRQDVARVSVKERGHHARNILIGAAVGAGIGLGVGAAVARCKSFCVVSTGEVVAVSTGGFAAVGAIIGAVIPSGGWREIYKQ